MEDARALLDSLMGPSRDKNQKDQKDDEWKGRDVCKRFLIGFCPNNAQDNWFHNTRRDTGVCKKIHSERLKSDFEKHPDRKKHEEEYERDFLLFLEGLVSEADAWIARERKNCSAPGKVTRLTPGQRQNIAEMQERSEDLMKQAEDMVENNDLSGSKVAVETANRLKEEIAELKEKNTFISGGEQVCEICGVRCNPDEQADYKAHLDGKLHDAYKQIRDKVKELRGKMRNPGPRSRDEKESGGRDREGRDKERDQDRKDKGKERDKDNDKEKDKDKEKDGNRGGARSRSRDRKKDRDRDRDRERDRERGRDRDRDRKR